jgi:hypothetical protein
MGRVANMILGCRLPGSVKGLRFYIRLETRVLLNYFSIFCLHLYDHSNICTLCVNLVMFLNVFINKLLLTVR